MKTANKTPYEIRLELLQLSFDVLSARCRGQTVKDGEAPCFPSTDDVIKEAEKLNSFVSKASINS